MRRTSGEEEDQVGEEESRTILEGQVRGVEVRDVEAGEYSNVITAPHTSF